jgi:transcriptional regulator with GAF, ATPase, and Fis domain
MFNDAADERSALEGACEHVRGRLGMAAVSVFAWRHGQALLLANAGGRPCDALAAARAAERGAVWPADAVDGDVCTTIRWGGDVVGVAGARWLPGTAAPAAVTEAILTALTSAAAGSVRALGDALELMSEPPGATAGILGVSRAVAALRGLVLRAGATSFPVLIEGESGTGKELTAKAVHLASERRGRQFCAVNCAALSEDLLEAELFGHARGAFTGASTDRPGLFEDADGGTLFLDEISELSPRGQAKLLRAIQEREIRRVGENGHRRVDVRIVCATNKPLGDEVVAGRFRQDLFYRVDVVRIHVPPLRDRPEDIPLLADRFWREALEQTGGRAILSSETVAALAGRPWPGNIRELQNTLAALAVRVPRHGRVGPRDLTWFWPEASGARQVRRTLDDARRAFEVEFVRSVLDRSGGQRSRAAAELGVTRQGLAKLVTRLGITPAGRAGSAWGGPVASEARALSQAAVQREERGVLRKHIEAPRDGG